MFTAIADLQTAWQVTGLTTYVAVASAQLQTVFIFRVQGQGLRVAKTDVELHSRKLARSTNYLPAWQLQEDATSNSGTYNALSQEASILSTVHAIFAWLPRSRSAGRLPNVDTCSADGMTADKAHQQATYSSGGSICWPPS